MAECQNAHHGGYPGCSVSRTQVDSRPGEKIGQGADPARRRGRTAPSPEAAAIQKSRAPSRAFESVRQARHRQCENLRAHSFSLISTFALLFPTTGPFTVQLHENPLTTLTPILAFPSADFHNLTSYA